MKKIGRRENQHEEGESRTSEKFFRLKEPSGEQIKQ